jgi:hypothetical protein
MLIFAYSSWNLFGRSGIHTWGHDFLHALPDTSPVSPPERRHFDLRLQWWADGSVQREHPQATELKTGCWMETPLLQTP